MASISLKEHVRKRIVLHRMHEQGFGHSEIAQQINRTPKYVARYLARPKPKLPDPPRGHDWRDEAACIGRNTELFFPTAAGGAAEKQRDEAKAICASCPVIEQCRMAAIANMECNGIWAGEDFSRYQYRINEVTGDVSVWARRSKRGPYQKVS